MSLFKCKHPFKSLAVYKDSTTAPSDKYPEDYNHITLHLLCRKCGAGNLEKLGTDGALSITYAKSIRSHEEVVAGMVADLKNKKELE